ncbi:MAG: pyridoxal phosphate-dependent aminotransferase [Bdellovibrionales bacterium]|nr:pyridoxal phosphate-dependent aminotransferase [Bdellovibrionales bacterium]
MLANRVKNLKPSPTLALAAKAKELKAQGNDVISLTVGEPDWDTFATIKQAAIQAIENGETKYTPASGMPELRKIIAEQTSKDLSLNYAAEEVTVSAGGKFVIFSALQSLLDPGDEVIIPAPYWVSYPTQVELAEGKPVIVPTKKENRFMLTGAELEKAITDKTKMLIINSPSNPTGNMYSAEALNDLAQVLLKYPKIMLMSDDIYNRLVFNKEGLAPHILHQAPQLKDRVIIINGVSKTYSMTGWRLGWALGPKSVIAAMSNYQSQSVSCAAAFTQRASIEAIRACDEELKSSIKSLLVRRDFVIEHLNQLAHVTLEVPDGAFYVWPDISYYLGKSWQGKKLVDSGDFSTALLESQMVATVPGKEFGQEGYLRLSYAVKEERMKEAIARIQTFLQQLN